ncbi:ATP-binding protein [Streptomyces somaliensis]|uniref:ATP-binding protein n=1 Tax=Streptomyces somaliensis TaxID=78355 RepID=UPI0020CC43C2|nr:ATP-binding protein [Streptomyces somaliensis]MCP9946440.1 ATP-binding protein [Streptomyces somaliensis]
MARTSPATPPNAGSPTGGTARRPQPGDEEATTASLLIAELTANAALHGRVRGRHARLVLTLTAGTLRIEVTDARGDRLPEPAPGGDGDGDGDGESGRGLLLVASLADAWGCEPHHPGGKTIWAECGRREPALEGGV